MPIINYILVIDFFVFNIDDTVLSVLKTTHIHCDLT